MGKGLEEIWGGAKAKTVDLEEAARNAREAAEAACKNAAAESKAQILEKRQQILSGSEGCGNPLHDGLIVLYGERLGPSIVEKYERVDSYLKQIAIGEPVVAIRRRIESSGCSGFGGKLHYHLDRIIAMGILDGEDIIFDYEDLKSKLPTSKYKFDYWSFHEDIEAIEGNIVIDSTGNDYLHIRSGFQIQCLDMPLRLLAGESVELPAFEPQPVLDTEILIGRENIKDWLAAPKDNLARDYYFSAMRNLSKDLGIKPIEPATEWQRVNMEDRGRY